MPNVVYAPFTSLDGFVADANGNIDFHTPDEDVHRYMNDLESSYSDHIYDERTYQVMRSWEHLSESDQQEAIMRDYGALWHSLRKTVVSESTSGIDPDIYTVVPELTHDVLADIISNATGDISLSNAEMAAAALAHGQLDRIHLGIVPVILGGGTPLFASMQRTSLNLVDTKKFRSGWIFLTYDVARP